MFYSTDILARRPFHHHGGNQYGGNQQQQQHGLGVIWMAATLGLSTKRLTRRDYQAVNVVEAWQVRIR